MDHPIHRIFCAHRYSCVLSALTPFSHALLCGWALPLGGWALDVMLMQSLGPICRTLTYFEGKLTHIDIQTHQILANGRNFDRWKKTDHSLAVVVVSIIFSSFLLISLEIDAYWAANISKNSHFPLRKSQGIRKNGSQEACMTGNG